MLEPILSKILSPVVVGIGRIGDGGGGVPQSLYWNPEMVGGTSFAAGVGVFPDDHTQGNNEGGCNATYDSGGNPAYVFNTAGLTCRLSFRQTRSSVAATNDLTVGHSYRFSADVYIDGYDGSEEQMLRGLNVNNNAALVINRDNADHDGTNGTWQSVEVLFDVIGESSAIFLHHGQGVITPSSCEQRTRNIRLTSLGETVQADVPALDPGLYVGGGTLDNWSESRNKTTLAVFEDGVEAVLDSTSPCGPALKVEGLTAGNDYNFKFKFEHDDGSGYSLLRFYTTAGLNSGNFGDVSDPNVEYIDEVLTATNSTMYIGALRLNHPAGAFIKISEISITEV